MARHSGMHFKTNIQATEPGRSLWMPGQLGQQSETLCLKQINKQARSKTKRTQTQTTDPWKSHKLGDWGENKLSRGAGMASWKWRRHPAWAQPRQRYFFVAVIKKPSQAKPGLQMVVNENNPLIGKCLPGRNAWKHMVLCLWRWPYYTLDSRLGLAARKKNLFLFSFPGGSWLACIVLGK